MTATRTETDSFGPLDVPADKYWGAQTQRSVINFPIGWERQPVPIIRALGVIKKACALVNKAQGDMAPELADAIAINKADGENRVRAEAARAEYNRALHYLTPPTEGWHARAYTCSALTGEGMEAWYGWIEAQRALQQALTPARPQGAVG